MDTQSPPPAPGPSALQDACAHLDAAAQQLTTLAGGDPFASAWLLAGHVHLLQAGIHPGVRALPHPGDPLGPLGHLDRALGLLDAIPRRQAPHDLMVWTQRLAELRPAIRELTGTTSTDRLTQQRP